MNDRCARTLDIIAPEPTPGCEEAAAFQKRLRLNEIQAAQARPILEEYIKRQNVFFNAVKQRRAAAAAFPEPDDFRARTQGKPSPAYISSLLHDIKKGVALIFKTHDDFAARELSQLLTRQQLGQFANLAREIRRAKMRSSLSAPGNKER